MEENRHSFRFISKSTRSFVKYSRKSENFSFFRFLHGYIYGRWPHLYIGIGKGDHPIIKPFLPFISFLTKINPFKKQSSDQHSVNLASHTVADGYHGKAIPLQTARELIMINEPINKPDLEYVVPYTKARAIILENPDHIVALDCPCRASKDEHCSPIDVCLVVGEPFASFINEHQPQKSRWITQKEAVRILEEEDARGHVHHMFFKDAMLGRYYAICNCCSCCCGAMKAHQNHIPMLASSGYVAQIDHDLCMDCGTCHDYCQFSALGFDDHYNSFIDFEQCMGCGVCVSKCPEGAISLVLEPTKGVPLEISQLI
ncbi:MAG: 4Fe-4S binding protein [Anaerolineaceae bacterium]|nr:4Fe-4S binding protein [Anaerolineaceae bacterium]